MPWIEKEGRTVEEARAAALEALALPEDEAEVEVLREGAKGLFGLGGESAVVRARPRNEARDVRSAFHDRPQPPVAPQPPASEPEEAEPAVDAALEAYEAEQARSYAEEEEDLGGTPAMSLSQRQEAATLVAVEMVKGILERMGLNGEVTTRTAGGTVYVEVFGDDMGILIGRGGKTLEALQELVRAGVQRRLKARAAVVVDVEAYWERRREVSRRSRPRQDSSRTSGPR